MDMFGGGDEGKRLLLESSRRNLVDLVCVVGACFVFLT